MAKKRVKKTEKIQFNPSVNRNEDRLNFILIENFVNLQKALTNLSIKFEILSENVSKLLQLFEISAKSFSEKLSLATPELEKDKEFLEKLDKLLEQNKVIAKGITLMEEKVRERVYSQPQTQQPQQPQPQFSQFRPSQGYIPSPIAKEKTQELE